MLFTLPSLSVPLTSRISPGHLPSPLVMPATPTYSSAHASHTRRAQKKEAANFERRRVKKRTRGLSDPKKKGKKSSAHASLTLEELPNLGEP